MHDRWYVFLYIEFVLGLTQPEKLAQGVRIDQSLKEVWTTLAISLVYARSQHFP
jgi:hypothetical protein